MATPNTKLIPIVLDRQRHLLLNLNAYCIAEEITGVNYIQKTASGDLSMRDLRALLYAGLLHEDPKLTLSQVGEMVGADDFGAVGDAVLAAMQESKGKEVAPERPLAVPAGIAEINAALDREAGLETVSIS